MVYFVASAASLQTMSKRLNEDLIGPLQVKAVLDKSIIIYYYLLADWHRNLLPIVGAIHIH